MRATKLMLLSVLLAVALVSPVFAWTDYDGYNYRSSYWSRSEIYQPRPVEPPSVVERQVYNNYIYRDTDRLDPPYREYRYYYHEPESRGLRIDVPFFSFKLG